MYPGKAGWQAIADVIFGHRNPGGKLPVTWYPEDYLRKAPMTNMAMRANLASGYPSRTYRFYTGPTILPFGHGLSYTQFTHSLAHAPEKLTVQLTGGHASAAAASSSFPNATRSAGAVHVAHARCEGLTVPVHVDVRNAGDRDGAHTVLVYHSPPSAPGAPARQLVAFEKVHVAVGGVARVEMGVDVCEGMSVADRDGVRRIPVGEQSLMIDDDEEVQTGEGLRHGQRGRTLQEQRVGGEEPRPGCNEPEVQDDTRGVVAGQPHVIRQPGHALLVPLQQAQPVRL
nr:putative beta-D-xylosidase isoform X2 [Setaria viridis]